MMPARAAIASLLLALGACTVQAPTGPPPAAPAQTSQLPANVRPDLSRRWLNPSGAIRWPPNDGFAATAAPVVLSPGMMIDRFGSAGGRFFSPEGAPFAARALPYVCDKLTYNAYRVDQPLLAWTGKAAPWFDEPGGATQFQTDASASTLLANRAMEPVPRARTAPCGNE